ncbi:hypothetical protein HPG69_009337 [Diceros bicornis minor]|uniref:Galectin n=1 Tax=Diceros bicornis minor TaxID=77932 RepID=A0A7J7FMS9_DICBM|nr:hypothetical protein HPG69_009337 [Diceros bicornis minor]
MGPRRPSGRPPAPFGPSAPLAVLVTESSSGSLPPPSWERSQCHRPGQVCAPAKASVLFFCLQFEAFCAAGLVPGWNLLVQGHSDSGEDKFEINFLSEKGDIVFHIKPRFSSATMVGNAFQGGRWGQEEVSSVFPLVLGEPFEVMGPEARPVERGGPWGTGQAWGLGAYGSIGAAPLLYAKAAARQLGFLCPWLPGAQLSPPRAHGGGACWMVTGERSSELPSGAVLRDGGLHVVGGPPGPPSRASGTPRARRNKTGDQGPAPWRGRGSLASGPQMEVSSDAEHFHVHAQEHKVLQFAHRHRPLAAITRVQVLSDHRLAQVELARRSLSWG